MEAFDETDWKTNRELRKTYDTLWTMEIRMGTAPRAGFAHPLSPAVLLRAEGAALLAVATAGFAALDVPGGWWVFAACFLLPDVAMAGYLAGPVTGARAYNLAHTETLPLLAGAAAWMLGETAWMAGALIWLAHVGFDRLLGYGLKYPTAFRDTHLGRLGGSDAAV